MPLYEYRCRNCDVTFEEFVVGTAAVECRRCRSRDIHKLLSTFAVGASVSASGPADTGGSCGSCGDPRGPGSCARE